MTCGRKQEMGPRPCLLGPHRGQVWAFRLSRGASHKLIEDMVVALWIRDSHGARLFKKVSLDLRTRYSAFRLKVEPHHLRNA